MKARILAPIVVVVSLAACTSPTAPAQVEVPAAQTAGERPTPSALADLPRVADMDVDVPMLLETPLDSPLLPRCKASQPDLTRAILLLHNVAPRVRPGIALRFSVTATTKPWLQLGGRLAYQGPTQTRVFSTTERASAFSFSSAAVASAALQDAARSFGMAVTVSVNGTTMPVCDRRPAKITGQLALNTKPKG